MMQAIRLSGVFAALFSGLIHLNPLSIPPSPSGEGAGG